MANRSIALTSLYGTIPVLLVVVFGLLPGGLPTWAENIGESLLTPGYLALVAIKAASAHSWQPIQLICMNMLIYYTATFIGIALVRWAGRRLRLS